jgi:hypothetical protein
LTLAGIVASGIAGCGSSDNSPEVERGITTETNYQRNSSNLEVPEQIRGHGLKNVTEKDSTYSLEEVILNEERMYVVENPNAKETELGFAFVLYEDHSRRIENSEGNLEIISNVMYIPTLKTKSNGELVNKMSLSTGGKYGINAAMTSFDTENVYSGIVKTTNLDSSFQVKTVEIDETEFYTPIVKNSKINDEKALPFYLMPVDNSIIEIDANGKITLEHSEGLYRPVQINRKKFEQRVPKESPINPKDNPGEAVIEE